MATVNLSVPSTVLARLKPEDALADLRYLRLARAHGQIIALADFGS